MKPPKAKSIQLPQTEDFQNLVNLLAVFTEASNRLAQLQTDANNQLLDALDEIKVDYAKLQETVTQAEAAMELIALKHPEWFAVKRSIKTPYGTVSLRKATRLDVPNEEATIILIKHLAEKRARDQAQAIAGAPVEPFDASTFIRTKEELDLEALEKLDDATLAQLRIKRVQDDKFSVKPATLDLGKAVTESAEQSAQEAA
jgi:hypothetical protein